MNYSLHFEPIFAPAALIILALLAGLPLLAACLLRRRGSLWRLLAAACLAALLLNPVILRQTYEPLKSIVALIIDNSQSQNFGARRQDTEQALARLRQTFKNYPQFELRIVEAAKQNTGSAAGSSSAQQTENTETQLFAPLRAAMADVPPARFGGAILLTDGQVADIPPPAEANFPAPINALISGSPQDYDRRIRFIKAPRFALVGKPQELSFIVQDEGPMPQGNSPAQTELYVNGEKRGQWAARPGEEIKTEITLPHAGSNILELKTAAIPGELTEMNNRAAIITDGVRENLKVLLVSGEPHNGLRTWRDLLKSDTGVDLVHFTILRPPEKADNTPISQLSLIVFPTTELFVNRLKDFDLIIFDRYQHYDVLPLAYYDYMARYVENGGALLVAAGPEYAGGKSLALTPLARILPARPTGNILEKPFLPRLTAAGRQHPVSAALPGGSQEPPKWGRWLRQIEAEPDAGSITLMEGADKKPLMLLAEKGQGRVGMLLSDEGWLWARGFEGGGPYAALYRRMAHWLMKEPELEAESLTATAKGHEIFITRRTMSNIGGNIGPDTGQKKNAKNSGAGPAIGAFRLTLPSGKNLSLTPQKQTDGLYTARFTSPETGLLKIENGDKSALIFAGAADSAEFADIIATPAKLAPIAAATGGRVLRMRADKAAGQAEQDAIHIGKIQPIADIKQASSAEDSLPLLLSRERKLIAAERVPLLANIWALLAALGLIALAWWRESRG